MSDERDAPPPSPDPAEEPGLEGEPKSSSISTPWKALMVTVAVILLLLIGLAVAVIVRLSVPRTPIASSDLQPLPAAAPDSVGGWVDRGDSLINLDVPQDAAGHTAGFDFWARALASSIYAAGDSLPSTEHVQLTLDSLQIPGEVQRAVGDARLIGFTLRPRSAVRARASYLLYLDGHKVQALPLDLSSARDVRFAAWYERRVLNVAATGMQPTAAGMRPVLSAMKLQRGHWTAWDTMPEVDSLPAGKSEVSLVEAPGSAPVFVVRSAASSSIFEECPTCPHRYTDKIFRLEGGKVKWLSDQYEDGPYSAATGFLDALARGNRDEAMRLSGGRVYEMSREFGFEGALEESSWRLQPGHQASDSVLTFVRRGTEPYIFRMAFDGDHWRVVELERSSE